MKTRLNILLWCTGLVAIFTLMGFVEFETSKLKYNDLEIRINYQDDNFFVEDDDIRKIINNLGYSIDQSLKDVDLNRIEEILKNNSSISNAEVFSTIDGKVMVEVMQRRPIIRIFNKLGNSYYIDDEGELMPTSNKYTSRVLVASGNIENNITSYSIERTQGSAETLPQKSVDILEQIYQLARTIDRDEFWKAQIVQIYVNEELEIELIPRVGQHRIILGDIEDLDIKLRKLKVFYNKGLNKTGWNEYSIINLKFKDQIVCTKRY